MDVGPGSFTGIRVGLAAAKALGLAWRIKVHGYGCLSLVAAMARAQSASHAAVDVIMTGGHGEYFFEAFNDAGHSIAPARSVLPELLATVAIANHVAGDIDPQRAGRVWTDILPDASAWANLPGDQALPPVPVYGRAPDAKPAAVGA